MKIEAHAKVNIFLNVLGTLPNGYHEIETFMQEIPLMDAVSVEINPLTNSSDSSGSLVIRLNPGTEKLPSDERNIAYKAALLMHETFHKDVSEEICIKVEKNIPLAAGLAGGSADGAAVLFALAKLWNTEAPYDLAKKLGSDVPFCLANHYGIKAALATGTGTELKPMAPLDINVVLDNPGIQVPTPAVYKELKESDCQIRHSLNNPGNHLQAPALRLYPEIAKSFEKLQALYPDAHIQLSGSGPTVFAIIKTN